MFDRNCIYVGDARVLGEKISDSSIDLIVTDPPYDRESLPLYGWLSEFASRVLRPGRFLFAYGGFVAPEVLNLLCANEMQLHFVHVLLHNGGYPRWWTKKVMVGYKPVYALSKGPPIGNKWISSVHSVRMDKRFHQWGQGEGFALKIVDMFTDIGELIIDPFCGGGQVPSVCKQTQRDYIAFELNPTTAEQATERVINTNPPLPMPQVTQASFLED
jgi:hypothetical protein